MIQILNMKTFRRCTDQFISVFPFHVCIRVIYDKNVHLNMTKKDLIKVLNYKKASCHSLVVFFCMGFMKY